MMAGAAAMLFVTSWKLPLIVVLASGTLRRCCRCCCSAGACGSLSRASQDRVADVSAYVDEAVHEIRTVQAYAHESTRRASLRQLRRGGVPRGRAQRIATKALLIAPVMLIAFGARRRHPVDRRPRRARRAPDRQASSPRSCSTPRWPPDRRRHGVRGAGANCSAPRAPTERLIELLDTRARGSSRRASRRRRATARAHDRVRRRSTSPTRRVPGTPRWIGSRCASRAGERVALVGPSGAGKIDGVRAAAALLRPAARRGAHRRHRPARAWIRRAARAWSRWCRRIR